MQAWTNRRNRKEEEDDMHVCDMTGMHYYSKVGALKAGGIEMTEQKLACSIGYEIQVCMNNKMQMAQRKVFIRGIRG